MSGEKDFWMVVETSDALHRLGAHQLSLFSQKLHNSIENSLEKHNAEIFSWNDNRYEVNFQSVTDSVICALKIQHKFKYSSPKINNKVQELHLAIISCTTNSITGLEQARNMCDFLPNNISVTSSMKTLYETENRNIKIDQERIKVLSKSEEAFFDRLMAYLHSNWKNPELEIRMLDSALGYSSSQVYNKIKSLTGKSPSLFIRDFRLKKSLRNIHQKRSKISEVAARNGFSSNSYFSKCFKERFGLSPLEYSKLSI